MLESFRPSSNLNSAFSGSDIIELDSEGIGDSRSVIVISSSSTCRV